MQIGQVYYPKTRPQWRGWLLKYHARKAEVWVRRFVKSSGRPTLDYEDLVEECLCFGWIDGVIMKLDAASNVQRVTPRRARGTFLSELNRQRVWKLQHLGLMTPPGLRPIEQVVGSPEDPFELPEWIYSRLRADAELWDRYKALPGLYRRLKIGWLTEARGVGREPERIKRLDHFIRMTAAGKRYGAEPLAGILYPR